MCTLISQNKKEVEEAGIEPATCRMQSDHSTPELHPLFMPFLAITRFLFVVFCDTLFSFFILPFSH